MTDKRIYIEDFNTSGVRVALVNWRERDYPLWIEVGVGKQSSRLDIKDAKKLQVALKEIIKLAKAEQKRRA